MTWCSPSSRAEARRSYRCPPARSPWPTRNRSPASCSAPGRLSARSTVCANTSRPSRAAGWLERALRPRSRTSSYPMWPVTTRLPSPPDPGSPTLPPSPTPVTSSRSMASMHPPRCCAISPHQRTRRPNPEIPASPGWDTGSSRRRRPFWRPPRGTSSTAAYGR